MRTLVHDMRSMEDALDRLFGATSRTEMAGTTPMPIDVSERDNKLWVRASLPGIDPTTVEVTVEKGILTIQGSTPVEEPFDGERVFRREIFNGKLSRSLRIPEGFDLENVDAQSKFGVLTISIPKLIVEKPKALRVPIKTDALEAQ